MTELQNGNLGFKLSGKVMHGEHYGKILGFPTANIDRRDLSKKKIKISYGVWAGYGEIKNRYSKLKIFPAGVILGPVDSKGLPKIEAHLIGFKGSLYGKYLNIYLNTYLRPFKKFKSKEILKKQIKQDLKKIIKILKWNKKNLAQ